MVDLKWVNITEKYLKFPLKLLYIFGLWRGDDVDGASVYSVYSFLILFFTQYLYAIFQIIYMINVWGDIENIADASFLLLTQATLCVKISIFIWKKKKIVYLTEYMNSSDFAPTRPAHLPVINVSSSNQTVEFFTFVFAASLTIALWAIFPQIDAAPGERVLPIKAWYPIPSDQTPYYEVLYLYQIIGIWFSALLNASTDRLPIAMTALGCAQMQILKNNLIHIEEYTNYDLRKNNQLMSKKKELLEMKEMMSFAVEMNLYIGSHAHPRQIDIDDMIQRRLVQCILHHQNIVRFLYQMEECFNWGIFTQISASVGIICITGLQITLIDPYSLKFSSQVTYLVTMLVQIFFICRIGTEVSLISDELVEAAYSCPWIERQRSFNTTLLIFMERLKQPVVTRAGYFFPLSLQTFVLILRSSYSYFAVLQRLNSKK